MQPLSLGAVGLQSWGVQGWEASAANTDGLSPGIFSKGF